MTEIKGENFGEIYDKAELHDIDEIQIRVIHLKQLIKTKKQVEDTRI